MSKLLSFTQFVNEEQTVYQFNTRFAIDATKKKVAYTPLLHHFTTIEGLTGILKSNALKPGDAYDDGVSAVSLTHNAELPNTLEDLELTCRISLDRDKLEQKYTLVPYLYVPKEKKFSWECKDEMEEQVREIIKNVAQFIVGIDVIGSAKKVKELQKLYPKLTITTTRSFSAS